MVQNTDKGQRGAVHSGTGQARAKGGRLKSARPRTAQVPETRKGRGGQAGTAPGTPRAPPRSESARHTLYWASPSPPSSTSGNRGTRTEAFCLEPHRRGVLEHGSWEFRSLGSQTHFLPPSGPPHHGCRLDCAPPPGSSVDPTAPRTTRQYTSVTEALS